MPVKPAGFGELLSKCDIVDLLVSRGHCCETERIDLSDCKEMLCWAPPSLLFKLVQVAPGVVTDLAFPAKRFKRWPVVLGFGEVLRREGAHYSVVDGLHRCAVANARGYAALWAYVPVQENGELHNWETFGLLEYE